MTILTTCLSRFIEKWIHPLTHSRYFLIICVTLLWLIADNALEFVFPTKLESIGKSYFEIGILLALASVGGMLIDFPMGALSDRMSRKKLMIRGFIVLIIGSIFIFSFEDNLLLGFSFFFWGLGFQIWRVPRDAYYASLSMDNTVKVAQSYGIDIEMKYIGQTVGPLIAGFLLLWFGFHSIVGFYSVILLFCALVLMKYMKETNNRPAFESVKSLKPGIIFKRIKDFKTRFGLFGFSMLYFALLFTAWEQILLTFQPLFYGEDVLNVPSNMGGLLMACFSLPGIFISYHAGKFADKFGKKNILLLGLIIMGVALISFSSVTDLALVFVFALLVSVGWVISSPALCGLIANLSYGHKKGEIAGIWDFFMDVGFVSGPILGGIIAQFAGIRSVFFILGIVFFISALLLIFIKLRSEKKEHAICKQAATALSN
ncbi:MAG: MFS transporter [Candidatus Micrarchaeota archaeon]